MRRLLAAILVVLATSGSRMAVPPQPVQLPGDTASLKFAVIGDNGTGDPPQYEVGRQMAAARAGFPFEFVIMLGDNMYGRQQPQDFVVKFEKPYASLLQTGVPFYATLGNHDEPANRFYKGFNMHPLYSDAARHGSDVELRVVLEPLLVRYGVNVVFSGHEHVYERLKPQKGITYFVDGSSGQLRRGDIVPSPTMAAAFDQDQTFMLVEIAGDDLFFQAISRTGKVVDSGTIHRRPQT